MQPASITDYFTPESLNPDGQVSMLAHETRDRAALYITNRHGQKLLKVLVKSEPRYQGNKQHAQIKIIPYGLKRVYVWRDQPSDPHIVVLRDGVDLTYHGSYADEQMPKVHIKATTGYNTLINDSLVLPSDTDMPVPLFSLETGHANQRPLVNPVTKQAHTVAAGHLHSVRFDIYLAGAQMNLATFVNSMYFFNLFWTQDYLVAAKNSPLTSGLIIAPIQFFQMGQYQLVVRQSVSTHHGRPCLQFYNNKNYFDKLMNRPTATPDANGNLTWSTMRDEDARLRLEQSSQR